MLQATDHNRLNMMTQFKPQGGTKVAYAATRVNFWLTALIIVVILYVVDYIGSSQIQVEP